MEQVPAATSVTVTPDSVQTGAVVLAKLTGRPELAVALTVNGAAPKLRLLSAPKVIVWGLEPTTKVAVAEWTSDPLVPVIVSVELPDGVLPLAVIVRVELPDPVTDPGLNEAVAPLGNPLTLRFTVPL